MVLLEQFSDSGSEVERGEERVLHLEGELFNGTPIVGEDTVIILKKGK